ncbi:MAG: GNAT family N-acetyltransferase [Gammaproteobacteria bacterium]|nr:GNAT family N-acetyltransferase [Gammaproteobacteria bacterium]MXZ32933.1 GNAT family N-acetyltransferase [Gammaproteobacteria bacterium]MYF00875.1 GNAT family N-acetyltransferase [Gammaproteobacteria bacterium]MYG95082.1 GNAT family N-acetyltransferase [Gammaproteobacteria bacterium]
MLNLRAEVFVVEQDCAYQDLDGHDQDALHLCGLYDGKLACYARINAPGTKTPYTAISRVLVRKEYRGEGLGRLLMHETLARCERLWPGATTGLSAQQYLVEFYASLGFRAVSNPYDEEGIPHVDMLR